MHIALVLPGFSRHAEDWAIPSLQNLATYLAQSHQVSVFSLRYPEAGICHFDGLTHYAIGGGIDGGLTVLNVWQRALRSIVAAHRQTPIDLFHAYWVDEPAFVAVLAGRLIKRPVLANVGGGELVYLPDVNYGMQVSRWRRWLIQLSLRWLDGVAAGSGYQLDLCRAHHISDNKLHDAPLGVDMTCFQRSASPDWHIPTVVQAASLAPVKDQMLLLAVMEQVLTAVPQARLILAGAAPHASYYDQLQRQYPHLLAASWQNKVAHSQMATIYHQAHVYVQTSRHESQALSVLEAMACGVPVVGTPVGVVPEVACLPTTKQMDELVNQLIHVLQKPASYEQWRQEAYERILKQYNMPIAIARYLDLYEQLTTGFV